MPDSPLRIAQLMGSASRANAGVFVAASGLSRGLAEHADLELEVFAARDGHTEADRPQWCDIPVHAFPKVPPAAFSYAPGMAKAVRDFAPQIVHQHGLWTYPSLVARRLARKTSARVIVSVHGMLTPWALQHSARKKKTALWLYERNNLASADCIHVTSETELKQVRAFGLEQPVAVIPLGIELDFVANTQSVGQGVRTVLSLGRLHPIKGLDLLVRAWARVSPSHVDWCLKIVGPSEVGYKKVLMAPSNELGCSRIEFLGATYGEDKNALYSSADVFILPSHDENFALTVLEALGHSLPVVASTGTPWSGLVDHQCGWWVEPEVASLASSLDDAMRMPQTELHEMGKRGRTWVERDFTWNTVAERMRSVYKWLAGRGPKPDCVIT